MGLLTAQGRIPDLGRAGVHPGVWGLMSLNGIRNKGMYGDFTSSKLVIFCTLYYYDIYSERYFVNLAL